MWLEQSGWDRGGIGHMIRKVVGPEHIGSCKNINSIESHVKLFITQPLPPSAFSHIVPPPVPSITLVTFYSTVYLPYS